MAYPARAAEHLRMAGWKRCQPSMRARLLALQLVQVAGAAVACPPAGAVPGHASFPPNAEALAFVRQLYELPQPPQLVGFITGGGTQLVPWLLGSPGASKSVLELQQPYSRYSLTHLLGYEPTRFCDAQVARDLADAAFTRARTLNKADSEAVAPSTSCVGLGCTAALRSEPIKRGKHRAFIAVRTSSGTHEFELTLAKGARSRALEDAVVSRAALLAIAHACDAALPDELDSTGFWRVEGDEADGLNGEGCKVSQEQMLYRFVPSNE